MNKNIVIGVLVATTLLFGYLAFSKPNLGTSTGPTHYSMETFQQGLQIGQRGSEVKNVLKGSCSLIMLSYTLAASTTVAADCAVTGVISGDLVFGQFATSTAVGQGWEIVGASASSTSGYITFRITNSTGTSALIPQSLASSTEYLIVR